MLNKGAVGISRRWWRVAIQSEAETIATIKN